MAKTFTDHMDFDQTLEVVTRMSLAESMGARWAQERARRSVEFAALKVRIIRVLGSA